MKREINFHAKIKGRILVVKTLKHNHFKNNKAYTYCRFDDYSVDCIENRILKKAFSFSVRYASTFKLRIDTEIINFISPGFETVSTHVDFAELGNVKIGGLYKEYEEALKLAEFIIKRFGHNINSIKKTEHVKTPPFWIDMSLLFEFYVLGMLKDRFGEKIKYHFATSGNELDFLLNSGDYQMVIDAKYKPKYIWGKNNEDIRQLSGYARLTKVYALLNKAYPESIDCLIIYPDQQNGNANLLDTEFKEFPIKDYEGFYKMNVRLPERRSE